MSNDTMIKPRKIKHKTRKFFGWKDEGWARLGGKNGKKRSYGHYLGRSDFRTRTEKRNADDRKLDSD